MVSLAAAVIAIGVAAAILLPGERPGGIDPAAAALRHAALVAVHQSAETPPARGQFVYTKSEIVQTILYSPASGEQRFEFILPEARQIWIGPDGSGRLTESAGHVTFPTGQDRTRWIKAGSPDLGTGLVAHQTYGPGGLQFVDLSKVPTDPGDLLAAIRRRTIIGGPPGDWETFSIIGDLLRETYASAALRAALYEVAADLPGVQYGGVVRDALGRDGVAVAYSHNGVRDELIFDPRTSRVLGEHSVWARPADQPVPLGGSVSVAYSVVYLNAGVVDSVGSEP